MYFLIEDNDLLEKYNTIWKKVSADIKKEFNSEPVYNKKFLKTKLKSHGEENKEFYDEQIPKMGSNSTCLAVISEDSTLNKDRNYYPKVSLTLDKILDSDERTELRRKFSTQKKIFNSDKNSQLEENSQLRRKFSIQEKIHKSRENSQLRRKFSA